MEYTLYIIFKGKFLLTYSVSYIACFIQSTGIFKTTKKNKEVRTIFGMNSKCECAEKVTETTSESDQAFG